MILVYEPWAHEWMHYQFNKNFLEVLLLTYEGKRISYYGSLDQIVLLQKEIKNKNLEFIPIYIPDYSKDNKVCILLNEYKNLRKFSKLKIDQLFITQTLPHTMYFAKRLFRTQHVFFVMHAILDNFNRLSKFYKIDYYTAFAFKYRLHCRNFKYIVLGDSIKHNLINKVGDSKDSIISIDHPYTVLENLAEDSLTDKHEYMIGGIGVATYAKNSNNIFDLEQFILAQGLFNIHLFHIGKFECQIPNNTLVTLNVTNSLIVEDEFIKQTRLLDYVVFFYPESSYKLGASGAIFDAIMNEKPILAIRNDFLSYIFKKSGNIGYLFDRFEDLAGCVKQISLGAKKEEYQLQVRNLRNAKHLFSPPVVAENFKRQL